MAVNGSNDARLKLVFKTKNGLFSGSFQTAGEHEKRAIHGVVFQLRGFASGFFLDESGAGAVMLAPTP